MLPQMCSRRRRRTNIPWHLSKQPGNRQALPVPRAIRVGDSTRSSARNTCQHEEAWLLCAQVVEVSALEQRRVRLQVAYHVPQNLRIDHRVRPNRFFCAVSHIFHVALGICFEMKSRWQCHTVHIVGIALRHAGFVHDVVKVAFHARTIVYRLASRGGYRMAWTGQARDGRSVCVVVRRAHAVLCARAMLRPRGV